MKKRNLLTAFAWGAASLALAAAATAPLAQSAQAADAPGVAFVYLGNPGDAGWTFAHDQGSKEAEAKFGNKIKITRVENVPESADSERVFRDLANKGNKIIIGTSFGYQDFELKVAKDFPDTVFLHATGYKKAPNFGTYDVRMYQGAYLAGVAAGYVTKTNTLGARSVNPKVHTKVIWINSWFDPGKEKQAAETLIGQGADVLLQNTDSSATLATASEKHVHAFGWDSDMKKFGPNAHLGSVVAHWGVYYDDAAIQQVLDGKWKNDPVWWGIPQKAVDLEDLNSSAIPADAQKKVAAKRDELAGGKWDVFSGPIKDQSGTVKVPAGKTLTDPELQRLNWYVEGVDGSLPK
ncbi:MAG: Nucleoside ABC transporter, substrate-binding protein [uncultured Paraburkholderia sp.]|nr:MAG: Nucleoside ABC transporter, substrate-binding protein [uncultured Paraburkholderia sp.]CAH2935182.1 MAG: Nucleoside ABC transporter, substrate-binding protein [uncultured Paraburkholderia sp.]